MLGKLLLRYLSRYRWLLLGVLLFQFASALAALFLPTLNADIIDNGVATGDIGHIIRIGAIMLLVAFGQIIAAIIATFCAARAAMSLGRDIRSDVFARVSSFSEREVSGFGSGSLITRNTNDVQQVQMLAMMSATMLVMAPMMAIGGIIMALRQDVGLSWILGVSIPVLLILAGAVIARMVPLFRSYQTRLDAVNRVMREQLSGVRVVRAFVREAIEEERFRLANTDIMVVGRKVGSLFVLMFPLVMLVLNVTIVAVVWFGGIEVNEGNAQIGTIFAFMQYVGQILGGVMMASFMAIMIPRAAVSADRISEVLDAESTLVRPTDPVEQLPRPGEVVFDDVEFTYPGAEQPVLSGISFRADPGETVAIIGSTGAGKTTLVSLIP
ncbi:MAG: ABC transporter ATP-binding protein, partial [Microbacterium sp.]